MHQRYKCNISIAKYNLNLRADEAEGNIAKPCKNILFFKYETCLTEKYGIRND